VQTRSSWARRRLSVDNRCRTSAAAVSTLLLLPVLRLLMLPVLWLPVLRLLMLPVLWLPVLRLLMLPVLRLLVVLWGTVVHRGTNRSSRVLKSSSTRQQRQDAVLQPSHQQQKPGSAVGSS
jgi:hypothetical protein